MMRNARPFALVLALVLSTQLQEPCHAQKAHEDPRPLRVLTMGNPNAGTAELTTALNRFASHPFRVDNPTSIETEAGDVIGRGEVRFRRTEVRYWTQISEQEWKRVEHYYCPGGNNTKLCLLGSHQPIDMAILVVKLPDGLDRISAEHGALTRALRIPTVVFLDEEDETDAEIVELVELEIEEKCSPNQMKLPSVRGSLRKALVATGDSTDAKPIVQVLEMIQAKWPRDRLIGLQLERETESRGLWSVTRASSDLWKFPTDRMSMQCLLPPATPLSVEAKYEGNGQLLLTWDGGRVPPSPGEFWVAAPAPSKWNDTFPVIVTSSTPAKPLETPILGKNQAVYFDFGCLRMLGGLDRELHAGVTTKATLTIDRSEVSRLAGRMIPSDGRFEFTVREIGKELAPGKALAVGAILDPSQ